MIFDLPKEAHKFIIEPISDSKHLKFILMKRFLSFTNQIKNSKKEIPAKILNWIKYDVRSVTGSNLRHIMEIFLEFLGNYTIIAIIKSSTQYILCSNAGQLKENLM